MSRRRRLTISRALAAASTQPSPTPLPRLRREPPAAAAAAATPLPPAPAHFELLGTRNAPPRLAREGERKPTLRAGAGTGLPSPRNSSSRLISACQQLLLPPRPYTHSTPFLKKCLLSTLITGFLSKQGFKKDKKIWNRLVGPAFHSCLVPPFPAFPMVSPTPTLPGPKPPRCRRRRRVVGQSGSRLPSLGRRSPSGGDPGQGGEGRVGLPFRCPI